MPKVGRKRLVTPANIPTDHLVVSLRSYVTRPAKEKATPNNGEKWEKSRRENAPRLHATDWALIFDCETATTPDQRLRFGNYQLRQKGNLVERGAFYEPGVLSAQETVTLRHALDAEQVQDQGPAFHFLTRHQFVEKVLFAKGHRLGAQIVGFNLPFDISRLAVRHVDARGDMKGGFSFVLIDDDKWPTLTVKHLSQRISFIHFRGTRPKPEDDPERERNVDRGFFVDVQTLAGALLSEPHSLESLSRLLKVPNPKLSTEDHGGFLKPEYVRYALRDVQATWECFDVLARQLAGLGLADTTPSSLYSEASLGKAYLKTMGVQPWRDVQKDYPPVSIGRILSTYFGGRSEVHIRRQITEVISTDFLSMYPSVCTLMGLWKFVIASGITETNDTEAVRQFVAATTPAKLQSRPTWKHLAAIVQVLPDGDLFPVRAHYGDEGQATIGLNHLTSDEPMWFTLADVLVSKILTGKAPKILKAIRFVPGPPQAGLGLVTVAGQAINPIRDDFYKSLIMHRLQISDRLDGAGDEKSRMEGERQAIKILANSTSYGIFVELNVKDYDRAKDFMAFGTRQRASKIRSKKFEDPGRYFHPLLGTLITGAARLMLALAERQVIDQGLDWAFCDTDSMAIANVEKLPNPEFRDRALKVQRWFSKLNPYGRPDSILQLEKVNFPLGGPTDIANLEPPLCLAISAKRYVLFNHDSGGNSVIRKASGHGLGYLLPPYDEPADAHRERMKRIRVPLWQEDVWTAIIRAAEGSEPDQVSYSKLTNFAEPAASRYAATSPDLLNWFDGYNGIGKNLTEKPYVEQVKPFNFLLSLQAKSRMEMASTDMTALAGHPLWRKGREPHPAAPYHKKVDKAVKQAFDRTVPALTPIPKAWLKSYGRGVARYHLHPEAKFLDGNYDELGILHRRHVKALSFQQIGKEADNLEEREYIGDSDDDSIQHSLMREDRAKLRKHILTVQKATEISDRRLCEEARLSPRTLNALRRNRKVEDKALFALAEAVEELRTDRAAGAAEEAEAFALLQQKRTELGTDAALAKFLVISRSYATRLLDGSRPLTEPMRQMLVAKNLKSN